MSRVSIGSVVTTPSSLFLYRRFRSGKVGLVAVEQLIDLATPLIGAMAGVSAVFAELERDLIGQRTAEALHELRAQRRPYSPTQFGWSAVDERLEINSEEQVTVDRILELSAEGISYDRTEKILNREGRSPQLMSAWSAMSVRSVARTSATFVRAQVS